MNTLFFSRARVAMPNEMEEIGTSTIRSTPSWSYQCRAMAAPTSGLFWWSAVSTLTLRLSLPSSSMACLTQATDPWPPSPLSGPVMSFITPMVMVAPGSARRPRGDSRPSAPPVPAASTPRRDSAGVRPVTHPLPWA